MRGRIGRLWKNEDGQSLVEMAIVLPILLLVFCAIVDFGWIMGNQIITENASREGAREGTVVATQSDYAAQVAQRVTDVTPGYFHSGMSVSTVLSNPSDPSQGDITVTVNYTFGLLTPLAQIILGREDYTAVSTCIMKVE